MEKELNVGSTRLKAGLKAGLKRKFVAMFKGTGVAFKSWAMVDGVMCRVEGSMVGAEEPMDCQKFARCACEVFLTPEGMEKGGVGRETWITRVRSYDGSGGLAFRVFGAAMKEAAADLRATSLFAQLKDSAAMRKDLRGSLPAGKKRSRRPTL